MRAWLLVLVGCGRLEFAERAGDSNTEEDACAAELVDLGAWSTPQAIVALNTTASEDDPAPSDDGLEMFFTSNRTGSMGKADIWRSTRASIDESWGVPELVPELSSTANENTPELSHDALTMYFASDRDTPNDDIYVATRVDRMSPWSTPVPVTELNSMAIDRAPSLWNGDHAMIFHSLRAGGVGDEDFYMTQRLEPGDPWQPPTLLGSPPNTAGHELRGWMSPCGLELDYEADRGADPLPDFYVVRRTNVLDGFGPEQKISELSTAGVVDQDLRLSPDRHHAYFASTPGADGDLYEAVR
ncbi:MAG: hypothetical protein QM831_19925 [Kofleriaceae bacterium]